MIMENEDLIFLIRNQNSRLDMLENYAMESILPSLFSLIVLLFESSKSDSKIFRGYFNEFLKNSGISIIHFSPLKKDDKGGTKVKKTIKTFYEKLRNGISHGCVKFLNGFDSVEVYNVFAPGNRGYHKVEDFRALLDAKSLCKVYYFLANRYLEEFTNGKQ